MHYSCYLFIHSFIYLLMLFSYWCIYQFRYNADRKYISFHGVNSGHDMTISNPK